MSSAVTAHLLQLGRAAATPGPPAPAEAATSPPPLSHGPQQDPPVTQTRTTRQPLDPIARWVTACATSRVATQLSDGARGTKTQRLPLSDGCNDDRMIHVDWIGPLRHLQQFTGPPSARQKELANSLDLQDRRNAVGRRRCADRESCLIGRLGYNSEARYGTPERPVATTGTFRCSG